MTVGAYAIHEDLAGEGFDLTSDDYYSELDKRLRVEFPQNLRIMHQTGELPESLLLIVPLPAALRRGAEPSS